MKKIPSVLKKALGVAVIAAALPAAAFGHNLWLNATDYAPEFRERTGANTKIYFGFGHKFPVQDFLEKGDLREFKVREPDGAVRDLEAGEGGYMATAVSLKKKGAHIVSTGTQHGFYTMYFKDGRAHHYMGGKEGLDNLILSLYYENYAKALINVGETANDAYSTPLGHNIEIVPLENPYLKKAGDMLKVKVLYQGKPALFCDVSATYVGFSSGDDYAFSCKSGSDGVADIRFLTPGQWIVKAVVRMPASDALKEKCIEEKYTSTISFQVQ